MARLHTRMKRKMSLTTSFKHRFRNVVGKHRPKTFSTKEGAEKHAKEILKLEKYSIIKAKRNKRFTIYSKSI